MRGAIKSGELDFVKYLQKLGHAWPDNACDKIIRAGNTAMLEYALQTGCKVPELASKVAASNGHLGCLRLLHEKGMPWDEFTSATAARHGHLHCLQYAHENGCRWFRADQPHNFDFGFGHVYASSSEEEDNRYEDDSDDDLEGDDGWEGKLKRDICIIAAFHGQLECLQYAHQQGVPLSQRVLKAAARHPNGLECLKYAHQHGLRLTHPLCVTAVANQNIDMLQYLHENGCVSDSRAYLGALKCTTFECLKYLHENGCPWNSKVCRMAAMHGAGDMVLYLLRNGCPPDGFIWLLPGEYFDQVLDCFVEQRWPWELTWQASVYVAKSNNIAHMDRLIEGGCLWHPQTTLECVNNLEMMELEDYYECPWHEDTCEKAALNGSLKCLKYAYAKGAPLPVGICERLTEALGSSGRAQTKACLEFVKEHYSS